MGRNNRHTVKQARVTQRSKVARFMHEAEQRVVYRTANPRPDERGASDLLTLVIGALVIGCLMFTLLVAWYLPSSDGASFDCDDTLNVDSWCQTSPQISGDRHFSRCITDEWEVNEIRDNLPCVWDARHQGNGLGKSLIFRRSGAVDFYPHRVIHVFWHGVR